MAEEQGGENTKFRELAFKEQEVKLKHYEAELKALDVSMKKADMLNAFYRDVREHVGKLISASLLVNGGALTLSIGAVLKPEHHAFSTNVKDILGMAWMLHIGAIISTIIASFGLIYLMHRHSKAWQKSNDDNSELKQPTWTTTAPLWAIGAIAMLFTVVGLGLLGLAGC